MFIQTPINWKKDEYVVLLHLSQEEDLLFLLPVFYHRDEIENKVFSYPKTL